MEIRVLRYFLVTAREQNITKAAELLHITQPTLSRSVDVPQPSVCRSQLCQDSWRRWKKNSARPFLSVEIKRSLLRKREFCCDGAKRAGLSYHDRGSDAVLG